VFLENRPEVWFTQIRSAALVQGSESGGGVEACAPVHPLAQSLGLTLRAEEAVEQGLEILKRLAAQGAQRVCFPEGSPPLESFSVELIARKQRSLKLPAAQTAVFVRVILLKEEEELLGRRENS